MAKYDLEKIVINIHRVCSDCCSSEDGSGIVEYYATDEIRDVIRMIVAEANEADGIRMMNKELLNQLDALREERELWEWAARIGILPQDHPKETWDGEHKWIASYHGKHGFGHTEIESLRDLHAKLEAK